MQPPIAVIPRHRREREALEAAVANFNLAQTLDAEGRHDEALAALRASAQAGHRPSMTYLAGRLLTGRGAPLAPAEAFPLLIRAADAGDADANTIMATLAAAGAGVPQDWNMALGYLERGARLGSERAQGQLRVLAGVIGKPAYGPADWERTRRAIDVGAWMRSPPKRIVAEAPRIRAVEAFAPALVCDWLVSRGANLVKRATVYDPETGAPRTEEARSNSAGEFDIVQADVVLILMRERIADATRLPTLAMEPTQVLHYATGQRFAQHYDYLDPANPAYAQDLALRGQRIATFLLYLNEEFDAGETVFPRLGVSYRGRKGDALFFANVGPDAKPEPLSLHAGAPPTDGEKWLLSQWIRDRAAPVAAV